MKDAPQPCASTRTVLARARAAMTPASTTAGTSTGAAGSGSRPLKTWGRPLSSRIVPTSPITSPGGGSTSRSQRTATDRPAMPATTGSELVARRPPTSQVTRTTWAAPNTAPRALSIPPPMPPSSWLRSMAPTPEPMAWAMATTRKAPPIATRARAGCSRPARALVELRRERHDEDDRRADGGESQDLGDCAGAEADQRPDDRQHEDDEVDGVDRKEVHRDDCARRPRFRHHGRGRPRARRCPAPAPSRPRSAATRHRCHPRKGTRRP